MRYTKEQHALIREALDWAIQNRRDEIGQHPAPLEYPDDIEELEEQIEHLQSLIYMIDKTGKYMNFEGRELFLVQQGLALLVQELNNQIVTCPDPKHYAIALTAIEGELEEAEDLLLSARKELGLDD